ncbi:MULTISPECIES: hypothetical protein [Ignavibacterium]|jgi:hypothetical protein|uniref:hypothetical protein n=1 Tax=Ignavibacterium TaxID=795750 RepID=UPI0026F30146|nr:hypothetical protein [Ignavibacterium album]
MSAQTKTRAQKAGKFLGIALFAFLMFFNIKFAVSDDTSGDIDLFGLKVSVFSNSTYASGNDAGTCCPENGSDCVIGNIVRENKYYKKDGSCHGPY